MCLSSCLALVSVLVAAPYSPLLRTSSHAPESLRVKTTAARTSTVSFPAVGNSRHAPLHCRVPSPPTNAAPAGALRARTLPIARQRDVEPSASLLGSSAPLCRQLGSTGRGLAQLGPRRHSQRAVMHRATTPAMCIEAQDQDQAGNSLSAKSQPACSLKINCLEGRLR